MQPATTSTTATVDRANAAAMLLPAATDAPTHSPACELDALLQGLNLSAGPTTPLATSVVWSAALKPPMSSALVACGQGSGGQWAETTADEWLRERLLHQGWTGWIAYNDEPPASAGCSGTKFGHLKGILVWSRTRLAWLVHSVPLWPDALSETEVTALPPSGLRCGQSFLWLSFPRSEALTKHIRDQIRLMDACVYAGRITPDEEPHVGFTSDTFGDHLKRPFNPVAPSLVPLAHRVWHLAKDAQWGKTWVEGRPYDREFYEDALAQTPPFEGRWKVQSWLNGNAPPFGTTAHCENILQVRLPDGLPYQTTRDHAKWGVHTERPLVAIGDVNRTQTQAKRGGGAVIIEDCGLWRALSSIIHHSGDEPPPPPLALSSVDDMHMSPGLLGGGVGRAGAGQLLQGSVRRPKGPRPVGARASSSAAEGPLDSAPSGETADSDASTGSGIPGSASKGCHCKTAGCGHGRCGCRRAGRPCDERCGCGGNCVNSAAAAGEGAEGGTDEALSAPSAPAQPPAQMASPQDAAAAMTAALASLAAVKQAAGAVSAVVSAVQQATGQPPAAAAGPAHPAPAVPAAPKPGSSKAGTAAKQDWQPPAAAAAAAAAAEEDVPDFCTCKKGCLDKRCSCRRVGRPCGLQCQCEGCTNCKPSGEEPDHCTCKKGCLDKRCSCRRVGRPCGPQCQCEGCTNCGAGGALNGGEQGGQQGGQQGGGGQPGCIIA